MEIDVAIPLTDSIDCREFAGAVEASGFSGAWVSEIAHDPFLAVVLAAVGSSRIRVGTSIAVAFARNPMTTAMLAHDVQQVSGGRFTLGIGTQVKAHITRRFSMPWDRPDDRMRDYVSALRAIWAAWRDASPLNFRGEFYQHTLMTPAFTPVGHAYPDPPILVAAVGPRMTTVAAECADGLICHGFTTPLFVDSVTLPLVRSGRRHRGAAGFELVGTQMVATGRTDEELARSVEVVREQIAFYASTPAYRPVMELHGWGEVADDLHAMSVRSDWGRMSSIIDDDMVNAVAVVAEPDRVVERVRERWNETFARVSLYLPTPPSTETLHLMGDGNRPAGRASG